MASSRRDFLQQSATAASALTLGPLGALALAAPAGQGARQPDIRAFEERLFLARPVPVGRVRLTGGPLKRAQDVTAQYLLSLDPDRMMAFYRVRAGLTQKAEPYGGWDGGGRNLTGHIAGHHLSAVSLMFLATGDDRFKARADFLVDEMAAVQDANADGYLCALENGREAFGALSKGDIRSGGFDLNGLWSPWYTLHKTFAGLRDAYRHTGNPRALDVETKFAAWAGSVLAPLDDAQVQKMLNTEFGGMNEVLADLYADTGDRRWLDLSWKFEHRAFTDALRRHQDNLNGKHGNCQIPKLIGSAARYGYIGDAGDIMAASFFWDRVVQHHSYATGGHGLAEYFGPPDQLARRVDGRTAETCNVYNMLKLTRRLFAYRPDAFYADFHERALFNHILASIDPEDGRTSYMVPVGRGVQQEYQNMLQSFTCCVGSGMESHALHADGLYYESDDRVWVNLFAPSRADLAIGATLTMETGFPDGDTAAIALDLPTPKAFTLAVRRPGWAGNGFAIRVNGEALPQPTLDDLAAGAAGGRNVRHADDPGQPPGTFVEIARTWRAGDRVELALPKSLRLEPTPDDPRVAAILWGPLALAADWGPRLQGRGRNAEAAPIPVIVTPAAGGAGDAPAAGTGDAAGAAPAALSWIAPAGTPGDFRAAGVARVPGTPGAPGDVTLAPFYRTQNRRYSVYLDVLTPGDFADREADIAAERARVRRLDAATVGFAQPGEMQPERDFNYQSDPEERQVTRSGGRTGRGGPGWFSLDLPVDPTSPMAVVVTYFNELGLAPANGRFQILVDGTAIGRFSPNADATGFYDAQYDVPAALVRGKTKVTVRFESTGPRGRIAPVFGVRMIRMGSGLGS